MAPPPHGMTERPGQVTPLVVCVDVEPAARTPADPSDCDWTGFELLVEQAERVRSGLEYATGSEANFSWFLRMDEQIERMHGSNDWAARNYRNLLADLKRRGDEIGLHPHPWRWSSEIPGWYADFEDSPWGSQVIDRALTAYERHFNRRCRSIRFGDRWTSRTNVEVARRAGVRFDLTVEPGFTGETLPEDMRGSMASFEASPAHPFRSSRQDPTRPKSRFERGSYWSIPITTVDVAAHVAEHVEKTLDQEKLHHDSAIAGRVDRASGTRLEGWAFDPHHPGRPVSVVAYDEAGPIGVASACERRHDLADAGFGDGRHGWSMQLDPRICDDSLHSVRVRALGSGAWLEGSPIEVVNQRQSASTSQRFRALEFGEPAVGQMIDDVLHQERRSHVALVVRSSSAGQVTERLFDRLIHHERIAEFKVARPDEALAMYRKTRAH